MLLMNDERLCLILNFKRNVSNSCCRHKPSANISHPCLTTLPHYDELVQHEFSCNLKQVFQLPPKGKTIKFRNHERSYAPLYVGYYDFEAIQWTDWSETSGYCLLLHHI